MLIKGPHVVFTSPHRLNLPICPWKGRGQAGFCSLFFGLGDFVCLFFQINEV